MTVLAVDLAAKYSAACLMTDDYKVLHEVDSWGISEDDFLFELCRPFTWSPVPDVMVVEDLPHGLNYSTLIKTVCRLQGRLYAQMQSPWKNGDKVMFLSPAEWRRTYDGMGRGTGPKIVVEVAARYGYAPPADLLSRAKGNGGKTVADKVATDYCSAYLIARWAVTTKKEHGTYDIVGTSRYHSKVIKKSDQVKDS